MRLAGVSTRHGDFVGSVQALGVGRVFPSRFSHQDPSGEEHEEVHFLLLRFQRGVASFGTRKDPILECFRNIRDELERPPDRHSPKLVTTYIELLLDYCTRFYKRQFATRGEANSRILSRFERLLDEYLHSDRPALDGLPEVKMFASELCLSPNYFGDLIKKECGMPPQKYIRNSVIRLAKERLSNPSASVTQVADSLGFRYLPYFTRLFKKVTGVTPSEFRTGLAGSPSD